MNCALQDDSSMDEYGVAYALLPLATIFCRKLCTGIIQFAYTCIQEHSVWQNQQFWEAAFYQVPKSNSFQRICINAFYVFRTCKKNWKRSTPPESIITKYSVPYPREIKIWHGTGVQYWKCKSRQRWKLQQNRWGFLVHLTIYFFNNLNICFRIWNSVNPEKQKELITCEENTMYSQAIHYANRMVYLLIPLDIGNKASKQDTYDDERTSNSIANR